MLIYVFQLLACLLLCSGQNVSTEQNKNAFSQAIGNFSLELIYHVDAASQVKQNRVLSPFYVWTALAATAEGVNGKTREQLNRALRNPANQTITRQQFQEIAKRLDVNTTIVLSKLNAIFIDVNKQVPREFQLYTKSHYDTFTIVINFRDAVDSVYPINNPISTALEGRFPNFVEQSYFNDAQQMIITSAVYFKGEWKAPFNPNYTGKQEFYDSNGAHIGEVNMMYNKYTYPFANIRELEAKVIELPCAGETLSMVVILPNPGITIEKLFLNLVKVPLDTVFSKLKQSQEDFGDHEIEIFIPRFRTESNLELKDVLKRLGVDDLFDPTKADLGRISPLPMYVNKVIHKATIEVTEGTTAPIVGVDLLNIYDRFKFNANRPFSYFVVEKETNSIILGGVYNQPNLY